MRRINWKIIVTIVVAMIVIIALAVLDTGPVEDLKNSQRYGNRESIGKRGSDDDSANTVRTLSDSNSSKRILKADNQSSDTAYFARYAANSNSILEYTRKLQELLNSSGVKVIYVAHPQKGQNELALNRILVRSNKTLIFDPGLKVLFGANEMEKYDSGLEIAEVSNVYIKGNGATLEMLNPNAKSEHNHLISINGSKNIYVQNLKLIRAGGDGICIRARETTKLTENVVINNCDISRSRRQGISITQGHSITIKNCTFSSIKGTKPQSGIDIEPNARNTLKNIVVENCISENNAGNGFMVSLHKLTPADEPVTIKFRNCISKGNRFGFATQFIRPNTKGQIEFENCKSINNRVAGFVEVSNASTGLKKIYKACEVSSLKKGNAVTSASSYIGEQSSYFRFTRNKNYPKYRLGNSELRNCTILESGSRREITSNSLPIQLKGEVEVDE